MATDGDDYDPSMGEVIDLTGLEDEDAIPPVDPALRNWTDPTPESYLFATPSEYAKV